MKKIILFIAFNVFIFGNIMSQITINSGDMPFVPCNYIPVAAGLSGFTNPVVGNNIAWDYSSLTTSQTYLNSYLAANSTLYPDATLKDTSLNGTIIPGRVYYYTGFYKKTSEFFGYLGSQVFEQRYSIASVTGGANDSAIFPNQNYPVGTIAKTLIFPMTIGTNWSTAYTDAINFNLTIAAAALNNVPSIKKSYITRTDSVVGWGSMIVPTMSGPSLPAQVLMLKRISVVTDSFFIAGSPAPAALLSNFGLSQGQQTVSNRYMFWRKFAIYPMLIVNYGSNNFTTPSSVFFDGMANNVGFVEKLGNDISLFPNPANDYLSIDCKNLFQSKNIKLQLYNIQGNLLKEIQENGLMKPIDISELSPGIYFVNIISSKINKTLKFIKK